MNASLPAKTRPRDFWQTLDTVLMCVLIVAMCSQINLHKIGRDTLTTEGFVTKQLSVALSDVTFFVVFGWFCLRTTMLGAWRKLWIPPLPCWILMFAIALSALHSTSVVDATRETLSSSHGVVGALKALKTTKEFKEAAAKLLQFAITFLAAPLLFVNLLRDRRVENASTREYSQDEFVDRTVVAIATFAVIAAVQIWLLTSSQLNAAAPVGLWGSPNIYSVFVAISITFLTSLAMQDKGIWENKKVEWHAPQRLYGIAGFLAFCFGLGTLSSIWAFLAMFLGLAIGVVANRMGKLGIVMMAVLVLLFSLAWFGKTSKSPRVQEALTASMRVSTPTQRVKKQYVEWYAAMGWSRWSRNRFATGVGAGNYQFNVGSYYGGLPNEAKMPPDSNNLYLVQMVSLGALGLGALLWVLAHFLKIAWRAARWKSAASTRKSGVGAATFSALFAFALVNVFHAGIVRGMSLVLAFLLSLAIVAWQASESAAENEIIEEKRT